MNDAYALMTDNSINNCWVGARDEDNFDEYTWDRSSAVVSTSLWNSPEPIHGNGNCIYLEASNGLRTKYCNNNLPYLCKFFG